MAKHWLSPAGLARVRGVTLSAIYQGLWAGRYPGARKTKQGWQIPIKTERRSKSLQIRPEPVESGSGATAGGGDERTRPLP